jgi:hypothetical protein
MTDIDGRVAQYVALRDKKKRMDDAHKEVLKPITEIMEQLEGQLRAHMDETKSDAIKTASGTCYRTTKYHAALADSAAFQNFVKTTGAFDMLDWKANLTAVKDYVKENKALPPGVNLTSFETIGVRRS